MKCNEITELFAEYWDLPEHDHRRTAVEEHLMHCASCAEEFQIWEESRRLISNSSIKSSFPAAVPHRISKQVMERIYSDESWRIPVQDKVYSISYRLRRNLTAVISFFLALFIIGFIYSATYEPPTEPFVYSEGFMPIASAVGDYDDAAYSYAVMKGVPIASIGEPLILGMNPMKSYPDYLVVISMLGIIAALLIMNWFSRVRT